MDVTVHDLGRGCLLGAKFEHKLVLDLAEEGLGHVRGVQLVLVHL